MLCAYLHKISIFIFPDGTTRWLGFLNKDGTYHFDRHSWDSWVYVSKKIIHFVLFLQNTDKGIANEDKKDKGGMCNRHVVL